MDEGQVSNKYLLEGARRLHSSEGEHITTVHVIASFDTMNYYLKKGKDDYHVIFMMARIQCSRLDNSGFQERVFSTGSSTMSNNQARMEFDCLEKRTLLAHNKNMIREKII